MYPYHCGDLYYSNNFGTINHNLHQYNLNELNKDWNPYSL